MSNKFFVTYRNGLSETVSDDSETVEAFVAKHFGSAWEGAGAKVGLMPADFPVYDGPPVVVPTTLPGAGPDVAETGSGELFDLTESKTFEEPVVDNVVHVTAGLSEASEGGASM